MKIKLLFIFLLKISILMATQTTLFDSILQEDQIQIKILFEHLFKSEPFAYTLYFDKPMSFCDILVDADPITTDKNVQIDEIKEYIALKSKCGLPPTHVFKNAWKIFDKYQNLINKNKYLLIKRKLVGLDQSDGEADVIFFINKQAFRNIVNKHIKIFKQVLGEDISADQLLNQIEDPGANVKKVLNYNECLLGILLGFGAHNSALFEERENLYDKRDNLECINIYQRQKIQKKIDNLWDTLFSLEDYYKAIIRMHHYVAYVGDEKNAESKALEKKYFQQAEVIENLLSEKNWLQNILFQLSH